jgi:V8-like Glu-specific endopeptidase
LIQFPKPKEVIVSQRIKFFLIVIALIVANLEVTSSVYSSSSSTVARQEQKKLTTSLVASPEEQKAALEMWTREARQAAQPLAPPVESFTENDLSQDNKAAVLPPGSTTGTNPDPQADVVAQQEFPEEWQQLLNDLATPEVTDQAALEGNVFLPIVQSATDGVQRVQNYEDYGTAAVFTGYRANYHTQMHKQFPFATVGKLYIAGGGYCTASVISPQNVIVTAAHCVFNTATNQWYPGWTFVPADRNGAAPYGAFPWAEAWVLNAWINASSSVRRYDVAVIKLGNNSAGRPVTYYTGSLGRIWNASYVRHEHAVGYPSNLSSGKFTYICAAETFRNSTNVLGMGCNMEHGSSGGPWIVGFTPYVVANNRVNSVVSGGTPGTKTFFGARFATENIVTLCNDVGC